MTKQKHTFWFIVGSQLLYGPEVLETVTARAKEMAQTLSAALPYPLVFKDIVVDNAKAVELVRAANADDACAGIVVWCHTFSPSKMWINAFSLLQKPYCHLATQYNREIPNEEIDMDFMNLNQAAHGDREHGFIAARMRLPRKIIAGFWQDASLQKRLDEGGCGRGVLPLAEGDALWRQHARGGCDRGRQGRGADEAWLAGEHLGRGRPGQGDERRDRVRDRRPDGRLSGGL